MSTSIFVYYICIYNSVAKVKNGVAMEVFDLFHFGKKSYTFWLLKIMLLHMLIWRLI